MPKGNDLCINCGSNPIQIHNNFCYDCHDELLGDTEHDYTTRVGKDNIERCSSDECWICQNFFWSNKRTRPPKLTKKDLLVRAQGREGKKNKISAIAELKRRGIDTSKFEKNK